MIVLGIDPGLATVGYGVIKFENNKDITLIDYGIISTKPDVPFARRLKLIADGILTLYDNFKPDAIAFEELFFNTNTTTAIPVAEARGVLIVACKQFVDRLFEYTPLQIKQALTGNGRAEKKQVQFMVKSILGLNAVPKPDDAADALAVALCHSQTNSFLSDNAM